MSDFDGFESGSTNIIERGRTARVLAVELVVVEGPDAGKRLRVQQGIARIGTARANQLCLTDRTVSRVHCEVTVRADAVALRDEGSTNGTFVDGRRARDVDLTPGTHLRLGSTTIRVDIGDAPAFVELSTRESYGAIVGRSAEMRRVYALLEKAAATDATLLVLGETGTGKELVAQALHETSRRASGPFVTVDCGAIPEHLMESELFGHVRGAFTGAVSDRRGAFEEADGGTIFFDEIGELPLSLQPKLLRALESRTIRRVGTSAHKKVDVRVVAATHRSLVRSVNDGSFREDLYYRLAVIEVEMPPLRARRDDIPLLAAYFLERFTGQPSQPPPDMLATLLARDWPGNVRELRNFIERSISLGWSEASQSLSRQKLQHGAGQLSAPTGALPPELAALVHMPLKEARVAWTELFENVYVRAILEKTSSNVTRAAELAGVSRRFLQRTMVRLGMRASDADDDEP